MPQSLANIQLHIIFSTKNRAGLLSKKIDEELYQYLGSILNACKCPPHRIGGADDHVHISCSLGRTITVANLIEDLKTNSSKWLKTKDRAYEGFAWQAGYGAFSIGQSQLEGLKQYIGNQREHHRHKTFQEEFQEFLKKYQVEYDERYLWD